MQKNTIIKRFGIATAVLAAAIVGVYGTQNAGSVRAAGSASVGISPGSSSFTVNDTITTTISVNTAGGTAAGADVTISYDSSKLTYQSMTQYSTPLEAAIFNSTSTGSVRVSRGTFGAGATGTFNLFQITFKATAAGSASVSVSSANILSGTDGSNMHNGSNTSVTYTVNNPAPSPTPTPTPNPTPTPTTPPGQPTPTPTKAPTATPTTSGGNPTPTTSGGGNNGGGNGGGSNNGGGNSNPTPTPSVATPGYDELVKKPAEIKVNKTKQVVFSTETYRPVSARIEFGLDGQLGITTDQTAFTTNPQVEISQKYLIPGRTYTYKLILTDETGASYESGSGTFRARGFKIKLVVKDNKNRLVKNTDVMLHSEERTGTTNENGEVTFEDVEEGAHELSFKYGGKQQTIPVAVTANAEVDDAGEEVIPLQELTVVAASGNNTMIMTVAAGLLGLLALAGGAVFGSRFLKQRRIMSTHRAPTIAEGAIPVAPVDEFIAPRKKRQEPMPVDEPTVISPNQADSINLPSPTPIARPGESIRPNRRDDQ